jgi:hypothetical protein
MSQDGPSGERPLRRPAPGDAAGLEGSRKAHQPGLGNGVLEDWWARRPLHRGRIPGQIRKARSREDYKIGGYDVLSITVLRGEGPTIEFDPSSADGFISFPLIGRLRWRPEHLGDEKLIARKSPRATSSWTPRVVM